MRPMKQYWRYVMMGLRSRMEYRLDFFVGAVGLIFLNLVDMGLFGVLLTRFEAIGQWTLWQIIFLYSYFLAALGAHAFIGSHIRNIDNYIQDGTFDQFITRPVPPLVQLLGLELNYDSLPDLLLGLVGLGVSYRMLGLHWSLGLWLLFVVCLASGVIVLVSIALMLSSLAFWTVRSKVFGWATSEIQEAVQHYPIDIFGRWFQLLVTAFLPFAFVNYYPAVVLLGHADTGLRATLAYMSPLAAFLSVAVAGTVWSMGLRRYESTGN